MDEWVEQTKKVVKSERGGGGKWAKIRMKNEVAVVVGVRVANKR